MVSPEQVENTSASAAFAAAVAIVFAEFVVSFIAGSLASASFNPAEWACHVRELISAVWLFASIMSAGLAWIRFDVQSRNKTKPLE